MQTISKSNTHINGFVSEPPSFQASMLFVSVCERNSIMNVLEVSQTQLLELADNRALWHTMCESCYFMQP